MFINDSSPILLKRGINDHVLLTGASGTGKSYLCYWFIKQAYERDGRVLVLDLANTFDPSEWNSHIKLNGAVIRDFADRASPAQIALPPHNSEEAAAQIQAALIESLELQSYKQENILRNSIEAVLSQHNNTFSVKALLEKLENMLTFKGCSKDDSENISSLLRHLSELRDAHFEIRFTDEHEKNSTHGGLDIFQMSRVPVRTRLKLARFIIALTWGEIQTGIGHRPIYDTIVLDECQKVVGKGGAVLELMQEARKYRVQMILATQTISNLNREVTTALMQANLCFFFRPVERDINLIVNELGDRSLKNTLRNLRRGHAILRGDYSVHGSNRTSRKPIEVKFVL